MEEQARWRRAVSEHPETRSGRGAKEECSTHGNEDHKPEGRVDEEHALVVDEIARVMLHGKEHERAHGNKTQIPTETQHRRHWLKRLESQADVSLYHRSLVGESRNRRVVATQYERRRWPQARTERRSRVRPRKRQAGAPLRKGRASAPPLRSPPGIDLFIGFNIPRSPSEDACTSSKVSPGRCAPGPRAEWGCASASC